MPRENGNTLRATHFVCQKITLVCLPRWFVVTKIELASPNKMFFLRLGWCWLVWEGAVCYFLGTSEHIHRYIYRAGAVSRNICLLYRPFRCIVNKTSAGAMASLQRTRPCHSIRCSSAGGIIFLYDRVYGISYLATLAHCYVFVLFLLWEGGRDRLRLYPDSAGQKPRGRLGQEQRQGQGAIF